MTFHVDRTWSFVFGLLMLILVYFVHQDQFWFLAGIYGVIFCIYLFVGLHDQADQSIHEKINLLIKIGVVLAFPLASDDIYRFYWDGCTTLDGISPFQYKPSEIILIHPASWQNQYHLLNSPSHYSVYPPVLQAIFALAAWLSFHSIYIFSVLCKSVLLTADYGTIQLLKKTIFKENKNIVYWYAWNPLLIYEVLGNGHPEGLMIYFLVAGIFYLKSFKTIPVSINVGLAAAVKLFPVVLIPFMFKYTDIKSFLKISIIALGVFGISMLAIFPYQFNFLDSIHLYFGKFEFNGSIFLLWKGLDYYRFGFDNVDHIAPYLSGAFILWSIALWFNQKTKDSVSLVTSLFFIWLGYLLLSTTVHPWYILPVMVLGLLADQKWILIWSGTVVLSYSWYDPRMPIPIKYLLICIEYIAWCIPMVWVWRYKLKMRL